MIVRSLILSGALLLALASCKKDIVLAEPVYPAGPVASVAFSVDRPVPAVIEPEGTVTFKIKGLKDLKESFSFLLGTEAAEIVSFDDESITVRASSNVITSNAAVKIGEQLYYGPLVKVSGGIAIDPNFSVAGSRANGPVNGMISTSGGFYLYGGFTNFNNLALVDLPMRGVVRVDVNGNSTAAQNIINRVFDGGQVRSMLLTPSSTLLVAGDFSSYFEDYASNSFDRRFSNIYGLVRVYQAGQLDTTVVDIINDDPINKPNGDKDTVSSLNGGVENGNVVRSFIDNSGRYVVVGNFLNYASIFYPASTGIAPYIDRIAVSNNIRMNPDGSFDSTYNYNQATKAGYGQASGNILDATKLDNDDIILVGNFSSYQGRSAGFITKIKSSNGRVDETFNNGRTGANGPIQTVSYNGITQKILIAGVFTKYNGADVNGVVMLDVNGNIDPSFQFKPVSGGIINFARQIAYNNMVVVSGSFTHYNNQARPGLMFLDAAGNIVPKYNRFGLFTGALRDIYEIPNPNTGLPTLYLMGTFSRFDNTEVGNFLKINLTR